MTNKKFLSCINNSLELPRARAIASIKKCFKSMSRRGIDELVNGKSPLENYKVERGNIYQKSIYVGEIYNISVLELMPGSKISYHIHNKDSEYYIIWRRKSPAPCLVGSGHELENDAKEIMFVLSIKVKEEK